MPHAPTPEPESEQSSTGRDFKKFLWWTLGTVAQAVLSPALQALWDRLT